MMKFNRLPDTALTSMCTSTRHGMNLNFKPSVCKDCKIVIGDLDKLLKNKSSLVRRER